jgi:hypothetical protein
MPASSADIVFLPWVRQGAAAAINSTDSLGAGQSGLAALTAAISINTAPPLSVPVRLRGPGDVVGIDPHEIVRMDPRPGTTDFEPNYFAAIEFDRPDFPWLFTPARADAQGRLRPWLCLVVVRRRDGITLRPSLESPLAVLEIAAPANPIDELPDLSESHLWAHAQAAGERGISPDELRRTLAGRPELSLSRLLCPRLLAPNSDYLACVVPTFELGRKAGLGLEINEAELSSLQPAWSVVPAAPPRVILPVYHHWQFRTGEGGDFESLVRLLKPQPVPAGLGKRVIDISQPGFELPANFPTDVTVQLEGALQPMQQGGAGTTSWPAAIADPFQAALADIVNAPGHAEALDPSADPLLAPPLYGHWHAARSTVERTGTLTWLDDLNLDPRHRAVAAFGTQVIQKHQEALMAAAWEQAADLQRANQRLRQLQLSFVAGISLHARHFSRLSNDTMLRVAAPAFARIRSGAVTDSSTLTVRAALGASALPLKATSAPMRRIGRERGPLSRRALGQGAARRADRTWIGRLNTASADFVAPPPLTIASFEVLRQRIAQPPPIRSFQDVTASLIEHFVRRPRFRIVPEGQPVPVAPLGPLIHLPDSAAATRFRAAAKKHLERVDPNRIGIIFAPPPPLAMSAVRNGLLAHIEPRRTLVAIARSAVSLRAGATPSTGTSVVPIDTIAFAPKFQQPMYAPLRDISQELLLPGLDSVAPNSVLGLQTNRRFVDAYMMGLNFEMGRELLWRGFPTDQRGTYFDQFWNAAAAPKPRPDIEAINRWGSKRLGEPGTGPKPEQFVLLMRSDLLRRYPSAVIYATKAVRVGNVRTPSTRTEDESPAVFSGSMHPDVSFFGFDLPVDQALGADGTEGYFIVIQEQPSEPRFGVDIGVSLGNTTHVRLGSGPPAGVDPGAMQWGRNAAHMAGIMRQLPVRVAIHASQFISRA